MPNNRSEEVASGREQTRTPDESDASRREYSASDAGDMASLALETAGTRTRTDASSRERVRKPPPDNWIVIDMAMRRFATAGLPIKLRTLQKYCLRGKIRSTLATTDLNTRKYFLDPVAVDEFITHEAQKVPTEDGEPEVAHGTHAPDASRRERVRDEGDVYEHPYVKKLEDRIEKLETKYEAQVRRTEEIQLKSQEQLLELQRMTAVGQSQTLADFMLKAKDWLIGPAGDLGKRGVVDTPNP